MLKNKEQHILHVSRIHIAHADQTQTIRQRNQRSRYLDPRSIKRGIGSKFERIRRDMRGKETGLDWCRTDADRRPKSSCRFHSLRSSTLLREEKSGIPKSKRKNKNAKERYFHGDGDEENTPSCWRNRRCFAVFVE